jgi:hypothetical protein
MKLSITLPLLALFAFSVLGQDRRAIRSGLPGYPGFPQNSGLQQTSAKVSTNNYQVELQITHEKKTARYVVGFHSGQITSELIDHTVEASETGAPHVISLTVSLTPFEDEEGGVASIFLGRSIRFKTSVPAQGGSPTPPGSARESYQERSVGLTTNAALLPGKTVLLFDDGHDKITLKLTKAKDEEP